MTIVWLLSYGTILKGIREMLKMLGFKKVELDGAALIDNVIGKFSTMIGQVEKGVAACKIQQETAERCVACYQAKSELLLEKIDDGNKLAAKLSDLIR